MDHLARLWRRRALCLLALLAVGEPGAGPPRSLGTPAADVRTITSGDVLQLLAIGPVVLHCIRPRSPGEGLQSSVRRCIVFQAYAAETTTARTAGSVAAQSTGRTIGRRGGTQ